MNISGLIITFNEEKHIYDCVKAMLKICEEVIVIDSNSSDNTVALAKKAGARVYLQPFLGDGPQRKFGLQYCKNNWILNLDADEFLDADAFQFLEKRLFVDQPYDAYNFRMINHLGNKRIKHSGWYPDYTCRFFNKETAQPSNSKVHQRIEAKNLYNTNYHILHYGWESYAHIIAKKNQYTTWQAEQLYNHGKRAHAISPITHGITAFFKAYFLKKGIFYGIEGLSFSIIQSFFSYTKYIKLLHLQNQTATS
ncbi:MAG: glycosyltransferase family 2 protein [Flavobacteriaceae bacterium]